MDVKVYYFKMTTGEEVFGKLILKNQNNDFTVSDLMVMETFQSDTDNAKYMFMTKYNPYSDSKEVLLNGSTVVFSAPASDVLVNHYFQSLKYCDVATDARFADGIAKATAYLKAIIEKESKSHIEQVIRSYDSSENDEDAFLSDSPDQNTTKH